MKSFLYYVTIALFVFVLPGALLAEDVKTLIEERARDKFGAELPDNAGFHITTPDGAPSEAVMLSAFWMDRDTGRYLANAVLEDSNVVRLEGLAIATLNVPVPLRRMLPGDRITDEDLGVVKLPLARVGVFTVTEARDLVGMQVKRLLTQGRPVMTQSITKPVIIDRGDRISIRYDDGLLSLSAPGKALDDAHMGQEIRIVNLVSNTSLTGVAVEKGIVEVLR
ncbi:flagella basal body P-ring formation protein FlgA [Pseudooceanicola nitratireducens]|jgi:flagella basal body P-ring formation protein FlgA|uniref:Flagella basal body P-ring formation protein FlgA n=1 Tax=Pseudooceanicola nitratireducens TaxID=517719 RepID=A0A1I1Q8R3_9RHOB|nr:flagellar basal body P-ring formation chaperone FlgA [Pseudooceanicola nitratireducens]MBY6167463.1 flagellar basal body P-ring formation chaperone FlgA [Pseudooceanicola nitratireducens]MEC7794890.1 flagellar basal body P-ring formation chaperone FlgA [Pseudomonadota bacterium]SEJ70738.1 flagella basal body P-ring formation protein FlgA [Pseudooceanicola nitratireducens]SFD14510.1 flagella basal body P-ring formation protein FlgA [Pseudooceanicola nitratireducens]